MKDIDFRKVVLWSLCFKGAHPQHFCSSLDHAPDGWISFQLFEKLEQEMDRVLEPKDMGVTTPTAKSNTHTRTLTQAGAEVWTLSQKRKAKWKEKSILDWTFLRQASDHRALADFLPQWPGHCFVDDSWSHATTRWPLLMKSFQNNFVFISGGLAPPFLSSSHLLV